jgi:hypothetical protein
MTRERTPLSTHALFVALDELFVELHAYLDQRADAEYFTDSPQAVGNQEMIFLNTVEDLHSEIKTALKETPACAPLA